MDHFRMDHGAHGAALSDNPAVRAISGVSANPGSEDKRFA